MLPYEMASYLLGQWSGLQVSDATLWNWVQQMGWQASEQMDESLKEYENGGSVKADELNAQLQSLCLAISADGVMAPFRPHPKTPAGKTVYKRSQNWFVCSTTDLHQHKGKGGHSPTASPGCGSCGGDPSFSAR